MHKSGHCVSKTKTTERANCTSKNGCDCQVALHTCLSSSLSSISIPQGNLSAFNVYVSSEITVIQSHFDTTQALLMHEE